MSQPYMNQPPPPGYGAPPPGGMQPPVSAGYPNGPMPYGQRPPGPPASYASQMKGDMGSMGPGGMMQNGPSTTPGAQGDPHAIRNGYPQPGMGHRPPSSVAPPHGGAQHPPPGPGQLAGQMGAMSIGGQIPRPGMTPTSVHKQPGMPPSTYGGQMPPQPPGSHSQPGFPPHSGVSPPMQSNIGQMPGPPCSMAGPHPSSSLAGPPPMSNMPPRPGLPSNSMTGMPPISQAANMPPPPRPGFPPGSMAQPPISQQQPSGMPPPPTSVSQMGGMPPPPGAQGVGGAPQIPSSGIMNNMGGPPPPSSMPNTNQFAHNIGQNAFPNQGPGVPPMGAPPTPPSPGQPGGQFGYPGGGRMGAAGPAPMAQPQQPRKLDPDQMPSPIQVIEDDRRNRSGEFATLSRGSVPPNVTTDFTVEDQGNASPRLVRSTMYNIPTTQDMIKSSHIPFAMTFTPFGRLLENERPPPIVDLGQLGPVRCNRCKAYMCPYMQFIDGGRRFQCAFCNCATEVPAEYFAHLDHTGRRTDCYERPELCLGTYEFVATADYCKENRLPKPPAFIFMIDVSYNSVKSGLVNLMCTRLKEDILYNLPKEMGAEESEVRVGFVTYHKELHFYNVKGSLAQPQMMVVSDIEDVFVPLLDGFLVKLSESEAVIDSLLSQIPQMFSESRETEIVLGPVIQAGVDALRSAECAGKLFIFHSSLPVAHAPGALKNRDDRKLLGTEKEKTILTPQSNFYTKLGQECVSVGCGVELFLFPNSYIDVASVAEVPRLTGGSVHKYQYFQADLDGNRFMDDLRRNVEKPIAFDAIMRIRTSTGIRPVDFFGNFYMTNTTDVELATIDCDKGITVEVKHDDKLSEAEGACAQAAILFTSVSGQRRLRIINLSFNCCTQMADLFRNCEMDTLVNYMSKLALRQTLNGSPKQVREHIMNQCAQILACYRQKCASPSSVGQLILPECMKLLPLYSNCIVKSNMLQGAGDVSTDDRSWLMFLVNAMSVKQSHVFFYPRLLPLHQLDLDSDDLPVAIRCSYERLQDNGAYLIENGLSMIMWVGLNISPSWVQDVFAVHSAAQIDIDKTRLQELDTPLSRRIRGIVTKVREERQKYLKLIIVRQRDKLEPLFQQYLVEDRGANGTASYVDFLCHIHKEIRALIS